MSIADRWLLPDGVEEVLPPAAAHLEAVRRRLLDEFARWGFQYVIPPLVEYLESLLTGTGEDLDLKTFKVTDQSSGRMMGIRADITPQVARIDAHSLGHEGMTRLCYAGTVLHAQADNMLASRTPISVGAELFGNTGTAGDLEIVSLMLEVLSREVQQPVRIELGDVGIFRELIVSSSLARSEQDLLFELIQRKAQAELDAVLRKLNLDARLREKISVLPSLFGGEATLARAEVVFADDTAICHRLANLREVTQGLKLRFGAPELFYDLSELRGYAYHTGIVFAAYAGPSGIRLAKGGRYDHVGEVFGRARAATGFDIDLKALASFSGNGASRPKRVLAEAGTEATERGRWTFVRRLRAEGFEVLESGDAEGCEFLLVFDDNEWQLRRLDR
ncbi:MAG: ATP phosphoribosyltransferase regulatory subunit [Pseudomonadota bacterium]